jgi:hypothetical protein
MVWSLALALYLRWSMKKQAEIKWWSDVAWVLCVAQAAGALAFNIRDCVVGVEQSLSTSLSVETLWTLPSSGVVVIAANAHAAAHIRLTGDRSRQVHYIGALLTEFVAVCLELSYFCGLNVLVDVHGIKGATTPFPPPSIEFVSTTCLNFSTSSCTIGTQSTSGDFASFVEYGIGGVALAWVLFFAFVARNRGVSSGTQHRRIKFFRNVAVIAAIVGGVPALTTAILRSQSVVITDAPCGAPSGFNCSASGDFTLPGSPSGFWDLWASDELGILKSIFAW